MLSKDMLAIARNPNNYLDHKTQTVDNSWISTVGKFPSCSEKLIVFIKSDNDTIEDIKWEGSGSSVMVAAASISTDMVKGLSFDETIALCDKIFECFSGTRNFEEIGKLAILANIANFPRRVRSAILAAHTIKIAINKIRNLNASSR